MQAPGVVGVGWGWVGVGLGWVGLGGSTARVVSALRVRGKHAASRGISRDPYLRPSPGTPVSPSWDANERP